MTDLATRLAYDLTRTGVVTATTVQAATFATLRLMSEPADGTVAIVAGRAATDDGYAGSFAWDTASVVADDNSDVLAITGVATGRWLRLDGPTGALADLSVTTAKLAASAVTNEKVDAAAAIAGTKVAPAFGAQTIEAGVTKAKSFCRTSSASTTDATATVADTYTPPADCGVKVTASALGVQSDGSDAWEGSATARFLVSGGVVTQIGTTTPGDEGGSAASTGCAVGIDTSGGAIRVLVTGISGQTWRWSAEGGFMIRTTGA